MRLLHLHAANFAAIGDVNIEFGPGLNVLYGPNDLGKSTLVSAIRLALLLPHTSTHAEQYVGWNKAAEPRVELTFETEAQRIWRVRKVFGRSGSSLLEESKNGKDFDELERGRKVDAKIREILRWGMPEPGGAGGSKGLPVSFLATALLSTQDDVSAVLQSNLHGDPTASGKEQIAAALQAVAQDPLFASLLKSAQARRDEAYTDKGAKKTARGTIFKAAAERVNEARIEKERLQRIVSDSEGTERQLRELSDRCSRKYDELSLASEHVTELEQLAQQAVTRAAAAEQVRLANENVVRIEKLTHQVDAAASLLDEMSKRVAVAEDTLNQAQRRQAETAQALSAAEEAARAGETDPGLNDTVIRQQHELRKSAAERTAGDLQQRIEAISAAQKLVEAAAAAGRDLEVQNANADAARDALVRATHKLKTVQDELTQCGVLERGLEVEAADKQVTAAQSSVNRQAALQARSKALSAERAAKAVQRAALKVPAPGVLPAFHRLANDLAAARGALDVGLVVTVTPYGNLDLRVRKDRAKAEPVQAEKLLKIEAKTEVEVAIAEIATVRVRAGRREAQERAQALEDRWAQEVEPLLKAAGVADLETLELKIAESRDLDAAMKAADAELSTLRAQLDTLAGTAQELQDASRRAAIARTTLGSIPLDSLAADIARLGADPIAALRKRQQQLSEGVEAARAAAGQVSTARTLAEERVRTSRVTLDAAIASRDAAPQFPEGVAAALAAAQKALAAANMESKTIASELAGLEGKIAARKKKRDSAMVASVKAAADARAAVEAAQQLVTASVKEHSTQQGQLIQLRKNRDAEDLVAAMAKRTDAIALHDALPAPDRLVTNDEVIAARENAAALRLDWESLQREMQKAQGALEQVGGAVAREQLRDAIEACDLAESYEREVEAEYESWKLLLEQMKEADAAQASNLGQSLAPFITRGFKELTERKYDSVQLTAQLGTEGVVVAGALRSPSLISVGTRAQLSTLFRLALAEYLQTVIVLDDQLVQSDGPRMDWFRSLLNAKARAFQIVVVTCRPDDYLQSDEFVPKGKSIYADAANGFVRAIDLPRAICR